MTHRFTVGDTCYVKAPGPADQRKFWVCQVVRRYDNPGFGSDIGDSYDLKSGAIMDLMVSDSKIISQTEMDLMRNLKGITPT
jgi:hypothetical protein